VKSRAGEHRMIAKRIEIFNMWQYRVSNFPSRNAIKETVIENYITKTINERNCSKI